MIWHDNTERKKKGKTIYFDTFLSRTVLEMMQSHKMVQLSLEKCSFVKIVQCDTFQPDLQLWQ